MRIIPAIDIIDGKCVRLTKGDYSKIKIYNNDPVAVAKEFEDAGIQYLHLVDLDAAKEGKMINHKVLNNIASKTRLIIDFGGGLKTNNDIKIALENGASQITVGSIALYNPEMVYQWLNIYGPERIILGADCRERKIAVNGWQSDSETDVLEYILNYKKMGIETVVCTDISKDGMLQGPASELYAEILMKTTAKLIASGGIATLDDIQAINTLGCDGVIIGKAIYEGNITLKELSSLC
jgi:phosphoribosylformimino-5-aminoimidazole carboxamide ribotide isomerase